MLMSICSAAIPSLRAPLGRGQLGDLGEVDLLEQPPASFRVSGALGRQDLERDPPVVAEVVGQVDGRHAALAQLPLDPVRRELPQALPCAPVGAAVAAVDQLFDG